MYASNANVRSNQTQPDKQVKTRLPQILTNAKQASQWLKNRDNIDTVSHCHLLAYPTESVWGIGCDAMNQQAVEKILTLKNRPIEKGLIVITDDIVRLLPFIKGLSERQQNAIQSSWQANNQQQATTWVVPIPAEVHIPNWITGEHQSLAIRVIAHPLIKQLCAHMVSDANPFGFIVSTSCNPATLEPARTLQQAQEYFEKHQDVCYLQADTLNYSMPSRICDALTGEVIR